MAIRRKKHFERKLQQKIGLKGSTSVYGKCAYIFLYLSNKLLLRFWCETVLMLFKIQNIALSKSSLNQEADHL